MAISREKKEAFVAEYTDKLGRAQATYLTDYRGLKVADISALRAELRKESNAELAVAKNTLFGRALKEMGWTVPEDLLAGPTAVLFCYDDPITPAKVLTRYVKKNDLVSIKGGIMPTRKLATQDVQSMADLPSREEILGGLVAAVRGPAQSLYSTLTAPLRELAQVLHARGQQGQTGEAEA